MQSGLEVWFDVTCPECHKAQRQSVAAACQFGHEEMLECDACGDSFGVSLELVPVPGVYRMIPISDDESGGRPRAPGWEERECCSCCGNVLLKGEGEQCAPCEQRAKQRTLDGCPYQPAEDLPGAAADQVAPGDGLPADEDPIAAVSTALRNMAAQRDYAVLRAAWWELCSVCAKGMGEHCAACSNNHHGAKA